MALVAIDIGNTLIKCGRFRQGILEETWQYETKDGVEDGARVSSELISRIADDQLAMASVVPKVAAALEKNIKRTIFKVAFDNQKFIKGINPTCGADRIADAVAGRQLYAPAQNLAVLAMGTCTVLTTVSSSGVSSGGFITLGLEQMIAGLKIAAGLVSDLSEIDQRQFALDFGFNTRDQIVNGTALGQIGIIENWLKLARSKLGEPLITVATGGNATLLSGNNNALGRLIDHIDPHLTLKGVDIIASAQKA